MQGTTSLGLLAVLLLLLCGTSHGYQGSGYGAPVNTRGSAPARHGYLPHPYEKPPPSHVQIGSISAIHGYSVRSEPPHLRALGYQGPGAGNYYGSARAIKTAFVDERHGANTRIEQFFKPASAVPASSPTPQRVYNTFQLLRPEAPPPPPERSSRAPPRAPQPTGGDINPATARSSVATAAGLGSSGPIGVNSGLGGFGGGIGVRPFAVPEQHHQPHLMQQQRLAATMQFGARRATAHMHPPHQRVGFAWSRPLFQRVFIARASENALSPCPPPSCPSRPRRSAFTRPSRREAGPAHLAPR